MCRKYVTFSFDDGEDFDIRLVELLNKYNMKATFFIITDNIGESVLFHRYDKDIIVRRTTENELKECYTNMEIASHTTDHSCCIGINDDFVEKKIKPSFRRIEEVTGEMCIGLAYPGGGYDIESANILRKNGVKYARTIDCTYSFDVPKDFLVWNPTCKFNDNSIATLVERFIETDFDSDVLFNIYGHSYEFDNPEKKWWGCFEENVLRPISRGRGIISVTYKEFLEIMGGLNYENI